MEKNQLQVNPTVKYIMEHRYTKYIVIAIIATSVFSVVAFFFLLFSFFAFPIFLSHPLSPTREGWAKNGKAILSFATVREPYLLSGMESPTACKSRRPTGKKA